MTMSYLLHDSLGEIETSELSGQSRVSLGKQRLSLSAGAVIIEEKFRIPEHAEALERQRLHELLDCSIEQYGATLISGRAGTGKTTLAADFARRHKNSRWYTIEPADSDWAEFSAAFGLSLTGPKKRRTKASRSSSPDVADVSAFLAYCFGTLKRQRHTSSKLIVLDNVHHLFDALWFSDFFRQLIISLDERTKLLMLCRGKPNAPLWRLRSKQMLNVIDENMLDMTEDEAIELAASRGLSKAVGKDAHMRSFGRASKLIKLLDDLK